VYISSANIHTLLEGSTQRNPWSSLCTMLELQSKLIIIASPPPYTLTD
jgi:hypothetical protein